MSTDGIKFGVCRLCEHNIKDASGFYEFANDFYGEQYWERCDLSSSMSLLTTEYFGDVLESLFAHLISRSDADVPSGCPHRDKHFPPPPPPLPEQTKLF